MQLDFLNQEVKINRSVIKFTNTELKILHILQNNKGNTLTRKTILSSLKRNCDTNLVDVYIHKIRTKLKGLSKIESIRGNGYRLISQN